MIHPNEHPTTGARELIIRVEQPGDVEAIRQVNLEAFGQPTEADLVDVLRQSCRDGLSLVAEVEGGIVGHGQIEGMGLAPMAVSPSRQRQGIGSRLVEEGLRILRDSGCPFVLVVGHPEYYPRFGFEPASGHGLRCQWEGVPDEAFMVVILDLAGAEGLAGVARYRDEFDTAM